MMSPKLKALFWSSRPISWVNTAYPFGAAYLLLTREIDALFFLGTLFFLVPYNVLMYGVNDVFDYESDINNPRKGGIEGITLKKEWHPFVIKTAVLLCLPFVIYLLMQGNAAAKIFLAYLLFMNVAYSAPLLRFKEKPFLDSFTSSTHFVSPLVYALLLTGWQQDYWPVVISFFLWGMASHAFGAVQDIIPDKQGGISSVATIIGGSRTVQASFVLYSASSALLLTLSWPYIMAAIIPLLYAVSISPYLKITEKKSGRAHDGWVRFIKLNWLAGFLITLLVIISYRSSH